MADQTCEDCQPITSNTSNAHAATNEIAPIKQAEDVTDPSTFIKPDLKSEVHVIIEYCNRW